MKIPKDFPEKDGLERVPIMPGATMHDETGTRLSPDTIAFTWHPTDGFALFVPDMEDEEIVTLEMMLMTACMLLSTKDEEWVNETVQAVWPEAPHLSLREEDDEEGEDTTDPA
jgi:hypothetical protein